MWRILLLLLLLLEAGGRQSAEAKIPLGHYAALAVVAPAELGGKAECRAPYAGSGSIDTQMEMAKEAAKL